MGDYDRAFEGAKALLQHAAQLDRDKRYMEARLCYQEGASILMDAIRSIPTANGLCNNPGMPDANETKRNNLRNKVDQYLNRAEALKRLVDQQKATGQYSETIHIRNGERGFGYEKVFRRFLDSTITEVEIEDAYIQQPYQVQNLCRFCEMLIKHCPELRTITLLTTRRPSGEPSWHHQQVSLSNLARSLCDSHNVNLIVLYSEVLHDREIRFSNGWVIKIGRGLDYFQPPANNMAIGAYDFDLRACRETTINIYHKAFNKTSTTLPHSASGPL